MGYYGPHKRKYNGYKNNNHNHNTNNNTFYLTGGLTPVTPEPASGFRALNSTVSQPLAANTFVKVLFPTEQFDLENEYDPATSIFTPKSPGVYSIIASINFAPTFPFQNYRARVEIHLNGGAAVAIDNDFFGPTFPAFVNVASVSAILKLQAGDRVEVFATANISGTLEGPNVADAGAGSNFQAARFKS
ncbi:complement C1q domain-containing protein [Paenibacillus endoradicis]|uniref:complement C1q domain-containing protein n=1 Tax=Paenibacillus endoradicis TaxID=2972487 RepID=UPI002158FF1B|nr:complement C1q domain-containing protein [Paenibacillus endoradicis]MCR8656882.1 complement C1q domain-containing protein [Paenibacillus endoradicis]